MQFRREKCYIPTGGKQDVHVALQLTTTLSASNILACFYLYTLSTNATLVGRDVTKDLNAAAVRSLARCQSDCELPYIGAPLSTTPATTSPKEAASLEVPHVHLCPCGKVADDDPTCRVSGSRCAATDTLSMPCSMAARAARTMSTGLVFTASRGDPYRCISIISITINLQYMWSHSLTDSHQRLWAGKRTAQRYPRRDRSCSSKPPGRPPAHGTRLGLLKRAARLAVGIEDSHGGIASGARTSARHLHRIRRRHDGRA
jgi:hypothetical protein